MSGFNYAASISAAYASSDALPHPHARLASGRWLAFTGWESNPLDSIEKFLPVTSDFLLSQAYPGASLELLVSIKTLSFRDTKPKTKTQPKRVGRYTKNMVRNDHELRAEAMEFHE